MAYNYDLQASAYCSGLPEELSNSKTGRLSSGLGTSANNPAF